MTRCDSAMLREVTMACGPTGIPAAVWWQWAALRLPWFRLPGPYSRKHLRKARPMFAPSTVPVAPTSP